MLELPLYPIGGQGDGGLPDAEGKEVGVVQAVQAEFLADAVGDGLAGVVVAADGEVGVVGAVEPGPAGCLLLQRDGPGSGVDKQGGEGAVPQALGVGVLLLVYCGSAILVRTGG